MKFALPRAFLARLSRSLFARQPAEMVGGVGGIKSEWEESEVRRKVALV